MGVEGVVAQVAKPKTAEEYVRLVDQAIAGAEALKARASAERDSLDGQCPDEQDHDEESWACLAPLLVDLRRIRIAMTDGSYTFRNQDLPFMSLVERGVGLLPLNELLHTINHTHRYGLDIDSK